MFKYVGLTILFFALGCSTELQHNLNETSANEIIVALESNGVTGEKLLDTSNKEKFMVVVPKGAEVRAIHVLENFGLPRPEPTGFASFYPSQGLIPTAGEEHVLQNFARSQEIRRSLLTIDQVLDAQVNLVVPNKRRLRLSSQASEEPRASVVIRHREMKPPLDEKSVKELVAGSVKNLDPKNVVVIFTPSSHAGVPIKAPEMVAVGPISLSSDSKTAFQALVLILVMMIVGLAGILVFFVIKRRS